MAFEGILSQPAAAPRSWRRVTIAGSLLAHVAALLVGAVYSLWQLDEMPLPAIEVTLTDSAPPPPPPPPPARKPRVHKAKTFTKPPEPEPNALIQPEESPKDQPKEEKEEEEDEGAVGGVVGGVRGGVVGGVLGGTPRPPPPPAKKKGPEMVSARIARGRLLINPSDPRYRVDLPAPLARTGEVYTALLLVCVSSRGSVTGVRVLRSAGPALDPQFPRVLGRWRYKPLLRNGRPTAFCYRLRYRVAGR